MAADEIFHKMLLNQSIADEDIQKIIDVLNRENNNNPESEYIELKEGAWLKKKSDMARKIRKYLAGFANSNGGALIIGIGEKREPVIGFDFPYSGDVKDWINECLSSISSQSTAQFRIEIVEFSDKKILIIATDRSERLVTCNEEGSPVYYIRIDTSTLKMPEYLITDLVLGKRQKPLLNIAPKYEFESVRYIDHEIPGTRRGDDRRGREDQLRTIEVEIRVSISNDSFSWADDVRVGIVGWFYNGNREDQIHSKEIYKQINLDIPINKDSCYLGLINHSRSLIDKNLSPFATAEDIMLGKYSIVLNNISKGERFLLGDLNIAIYIIARNMMPTWYQLKISLTPESMGMLGGDSTNFSDKFVDLVKVSEPPRVATVQLQDV